MGWVLVFLAGGLEIFWASWLKYVNSGLEWVVLFLLIAVSFLMLIRAYRTIPVAIAYSVFVGIGTVGTYTIGTLFLGDPFSGLQVVFVVMLLIGIIGLKLSTKEGAQ